MATVLCSLHCTLFITLCTAEDGRYSTWAVHRSMITPIPRFREHSTKQTCLDLIPLALSLAKTAGAPMSPPAKSRAPSAFQQRLLEVTVRGTVQQCSAFKRILKPPVTDVATVA